ncbi:flagellar export chaperone FlgN [Shewanella frigidimarina]|jgi:flagella synthesis protein FlgN|uniref:Flagellar biosynthesis protein FlgN n=1 Tax=Shewanella frigidimarina TaxID=56812 RepID=A0A106BWL0_SHEFR|nr:flagellar export chaperone FlgN [Shewanella frigidimarina]KVW99800.1 flagellar biosynthesis protein FlgN [Shewanella frigidimarina]
MDNSVVNKRDLVQNIIRDVRIDLDDYTQLNSMLIHQRKLMQSRDNQALLTHNVSQTALCDRLAKRASNRSLYLRKLGFDTNAGGMTTLFDALPVHLKPQIKLLWENLLQIVEDNHRENEINGRLLAMQQSTIKRVLQRDNQDQIDYGAHIFS